MRPWKLGFAVVFLAAVAALSFSYPALAQNGSSPDEPGLSSYWGPAVSQWEPVILQYAQARSLDPDLIAAVIWKESLGRANARSVVGAVGLMGLMPFSWRPSPEALQDPSTNLFWGARALAHTIRDGNGDLYYSLAAYNGGWEQVHLRVTRRYATEVLDCYTRAVAVRYGLPEDGDWVAIIAVEGTPGPDTVTVLGPQRSLARYTERPCQADVPGVPVGVPPHTTALTFVDGRGLECRVSVWLAAADGSPLARSVAQIPQSGSTH
jgi:hypothetical protein